MKLASLKAGRDGRLVVVSEDLAWCAAPPPMWQTLQHVLDDWAHAEPILQGVAESLSHDAVPHSRFHEREAAAPLPRAYRWTSAAGDISADQLVPPRSHLTAPGAVSGHIVVVVGDLAQGASRAAALAAIRLIGVAASTDAGTSLSPVLATPNVLGARWQDGKLHGTLAIDINGAPAARLETGSIDLADLVESLAATRDLTAGTIISAVLTPAPLPLKAGDLLRVEMPDEKHHPIFGAIEQPVDA